MGLVFEVTQESDGGLVAECLTESIVILCAVARHENVDRERLLRGRC